MKTISVSPQSQDVNSLLEQARNEDIVVRAGDGTEYMVSLVDDFDYEIVRTRRNARLMVLLDERGRADETIPLDEIERQLPSDS
jgi:hypothetical protein